MATIKRTPQEEMKHMLIELFSSSSTRIEEFSVENHTHTPNVRPGDMTYTILTTGRRTLTVEFTNIEQEKAFQKQLEDYHASNIN